MLHEEVHACNTFDEPEKVKAHTTQEEWTGTECEVTLPPCSVCRINCYVEE